MAHPLSMDLLDGWPQPLRFEPAPPLSVDLLNGWSPNDIGTVKD